MASFVALFWFLIIAATTRAIIMMNRMSCLPCETADDRAYCNPPRPRRPV